jgi:hypothetical protein
MSGTVQTKAQMLAAFASNQGAGFVANPTNMQNLVASIGGIAATQSSAGLATGRFYEGSEPLEVHPLVQQSGVARVGLFRVTTQTTFTKCGVETLPAYPTQRLRDFTSFLGVNTHISQGATNYTSAANLQTDLSYLGFTLIRDNDTSNGTFNGIYGTLGAAGYRMSFATFSTPAVYIVNLKLAVTAGMPAGNIIAIEGPNEPGNFSYAYLGFTSGPSSSWQGVMLAQQQIYQMVHADPVLCNVPVATPSSTGGQFDNCGLQFLVVPQFGYNADAGGNYTPVLPADRCLAKDGTVFADMYNLHSYFITGVGGAQWYDATVGDKFGAWADFGFDFVNIGSTGFPGVSGIPQPNSGQTGFYSPKIITETGLQTNSAAGTGNYVDQATQGKNLINAAFQAFEDRFLAYIIYSLYDDAEFFGLFTTFNTPKSAATYFHNLTTIMADTGTNPTTFNSGSPGLIGLTGQPALTFYNVFQKSDGSYWIAIRSMQANWNPATNVAITVAQTTTTLTFSQTFSTINVFDPQVSATAVRTTTNASTLVLSSANANTGLRDRTLLIQLVPAASTTSIQWAIYATANGVPTGAPVYNSANHTVPLASDVIEETGLSLTLQPGVYAAAVVTNGPAVIRGFTDPGANAAAGQASSKAIGVSITAATTLNTGTPASTWASSPTITIASAADVVAGSVQPLVWLRP